MADQIVRGELPSFGAAEQADDAPHDLPPVVPLPRHGQVVLLGDLLAPLEEIERTVRGYAAKRRQAGHLLQVIDPAEADLPYQGTGRFRGLGGRGLLADARGSRRCTRTTAGAWRTNRRVSPRSLARLAGPTPATSPTGRPSSGTLLALYVRRPLRPHPGISPPCWSLGAIGFASPLGAGGRWSALPLLWWLLRVTPPSPKRLRFPAIRLLFGLAPPQEDAGAHPLVALAPATPGGRFDHRRPGPAAAQPGGSRLAGSGPLVLVVDDGWAAARNWQSAPQDLIQSLLTQAESAKAARSFC